MISESVNIDANTNIFQNNIVGKFILKRRMSISSPFGVTLYFKTFFLNGANQEESNLIWYKKM